MAVRELRKIAAPPTKTEKLMPLSFLSPGQEGTIFFIRGGRKLKARLRDLGLNQNAAVRVIKNDFSGPMIIAVKNDSRLAIGRGQATHILISPLE